jgi:hypothetical protein
MLESPLYTTALILYLRFNISYLERTWVDNPEWIDNACRQFRNWYKDYYNTDDDNGDNSGDGGNGDDETIPNLSYQPTDANDTELDSFLLGLRPRTLPRQCEIDRYFEMVKKQGADVKKPLEWWIA